jgi:hypothetical protein
MGAEKGSIAGWDPDQPEPCPRAQGQRGQTLFPPRRPTAPSAAYVIGLSERGWRGWRGGGLTLSNGPRDISGSEVPRAAQVLIKRRSLVFIEAQLHRFLE